jgi:peroxiredoxin Q/BCP
VEKGSLVADFELPDQTGTSRRLSGFLSRGPVVLYFYPAAGSRGCSVESRHFQDLAQDFAAAGAQVIGISADAVSKQNAFAEKCSLGFPLLSDRQGTVAKEMGVRRRFGPLPVRRWTFVIGTDRRVLEVIKSETKMAFHADRALEAVQQRPHA